VRAERKLKRLTAVHRAVEFRALRIVIVEPSSVVDRNFAARRRRSAVAGLGIGVFQSIRHLDHLVGCCDGALARRHGGDDGEREDGANEANQHHGLPIV